VERFETADVVLDCTGTYSRPNWIGDGAIPAAGETAARSQIALHLDEILGSRKPQYAGKSIILVGSGYSAATAMLDLATLAEENQSTWVIWLTHGPRTQPLPRLANDPFKERDRLAARANHLALRCDGNLEYHPQTQLDEILSHGVDKGFRVSGRIAGKPMTWDVERVIAHVGYRPNLDFCQELRVQEPTGSSRTAEPDYYFLGAKSWGRDSGFFLREGYRQIEELLPRLVSGGATARYGSTRAG
jgi:lysine/ornithine N-monooxygenase